MKFLKWSIIVVLLIVMAIGSFLMLNKKDEEKLATIIIENLKENIKSPIVFAFETSQWDATRYNQALYYQTEKPCDQISDENRKTECRDYVQMNKLVLDPNSGDCNSIINESRAIECKNLMFEKTANELKQKNLCYQISDPDIVQRCRENIDAQKLAEIAIKKTASIPRCNELEGNFQKECLKLIKSYETEAQYVKALKQKNIGLCNGLDTEIAKKCRDEILSENAEKTHSLVMCSSISDAESRTACEKNIKIAQDSAYLEQATTGENSNICQNISTPEIQVRCRDIVILSIAKKTKNPTLCDGLSNHENISICKKVSLK